MHERVEGRGGVAAASRYWDVAGGGAAGVFGDGVVARGTHLGGVVQGGGPRGGSAGGDRGGESAVEEKRVGGYRGRAWGGRIKMSAYETRMSYIKNRSPVENVFQMPGVVSRGLVGTHGKISAPLLEALPGDFEGLGELWLCWLGINLGVSRYV